MPDMQDAAETGEMVRGFRLGTPQLPTARPDETTRLPCSASIPLLHMHTLLAQIMVPAPRGVPLGNGQPVHTRRHAHMD